MSFGSESSRASNPLIFLWLFFFQQSESSMHLQGNLLTDFINSLKFRAMKTLQDDHLQPPHVSRQEATGWEK
jgi:hypothetical protein